MLLKIDRFSSLLVTAWVAAVVGYGCGGTTTTNDASPDGKKDAADSGSGGKVGSGGSGGKGGSGGTGGTAGGDGGSVVIDAPVDHPDVATDHPADAPVDTAPDVGLDIHPDVVDAGADAAVDHGSDVAAEAAPETAPEVAPETTPEVAPEAPTDTGTDTTVDNTPSTPDTGTPAFVAISPCDTAGAYATAQSTITFPTGSSPQQYTPACLKISKGDSVTFSGSFSNHPLDARTATGATAGNPIVATDSGTSKVVSFPNPGFFPFHCQMHPGSMFGVVWVVD